MNYFCIVTFLLLFKSIGFAETSYNPLTVPKNSVAQQIVNFTINDKQRQRAIPLRIYLPATKKIAPVVIFSHGLGGSNRSCAYLGQHWAARGYIALFMQHPGSDEFVWKNIPRHKRLKAMKQAVTLKNFILRVRDVSTTIDQLTLWNKTNNHLLKKRINLEQIGMSGHSFGASTTQALSGQISARGSFTFTDPRIKAAIMFSPNAPLRGSAEHIFSKVKMPWLLMTGTKDTAFITTATPESRLAVFQALPPGNKYELVLDRAEHSAFTARHLPGDKEKRNPNHHRVILALSTAFLDAYLQNNSEAQAWLDGDKPRSIIEKKDRWQKK